MLPRYTATEKKQFIAHLFHTSAAIILCLICSMYIASTLTDLHFSSNSLNTPGQSRPGERYV